MSNSLAPRGPQDAFLRAFLHDLRSPLASIIALANFGGIRASSRPDEIPSLLSDIGYAASHLNEMADMALFVTKAEVSTFAIERKPFSLDRLASSITAELRCQASAMGITIENGIQLSNLLGDTNLVEVSLRSLMRSAIKYSKSESVVRLLPASGSEADCPGAGFTSSFNMPHSARTMTAAPSRFGRDGLFQLDLALQFATQVADGHGGRLSARSTADYQEVEFLLPP